MTGPEKIWPFVLVRGTELPSGSRCGRFFDVKRAWSRSIAEDCGRCGGTGQLLSSVDGTAVGGAPLPAR